MAEEQKDARDEQVERLEQLAALETRLHTKVIKAIGQPDPDNRVMDAPGYDGEISADEYGSLLATQTEQMDAGLLCKGDIIRVEEMGPKPQIVFWQVMTDPFQDLSDNQGLVITLQRKPTPRFGKNRMLQVIRPDRKLEVILRKLETFTLEDQ